MPDNLPAPLKVLFQTNDLPDLGPKSRPGTLSISALGSRLDEALQIADVPSSRRDLVRSAFLLWHDHLDESHTISQNIHSIDGSFLHAVMHRREPDASNAKYWWNRVGAHPCFDALALRAGQWLEKSGQSALATRLLPRDEWDAFAFVETCERARHGGNAEEVRVLKELQRIEMEVFLEHVLVAC